MASEGKAGRGREGWLTSGRGIPTLLAVALLLIANGGFRRCNEQRKNIWTADIFDISGATFAVYRSFCCVIMSERGRVQPGIAWLTVRRIIALRSLRNDMIPA